MPATYEYGGFQTKFPNLALDHQVIRRNGGRNTGSSLHHDTYIVQDGKSIRIRKEGDLILLTRAELIPDGDHILEHRFIDEREITSQQARQLLRDHDHVAEFQKSRTSFEMRIERGVSVSIHFDNVEALGHFVQIEGEETEHVKEAIKRLGIDFAEGTSQGYLDMMKNLEISFWTHQLFRIRRAIVPYIYGIISSIAAIVGTATGVITRKEDLIGLIFSIVTVALFDSQGDAYGIYEGELSKRGTSNKTALLAGRATFIVKFLLPIFFAIALISVNPEIAQWIILPIAIALLLGLTLLQSFGQKDWFRILLIRRMTMLVVLVTTVYSANLVLPEILT